MKRLKLTAALLLLGMVTGSLKVSAQQTEANRAQEIEAKNNVNAMNRAQGEGHYFEYGTFATNMQQLGLGIQPETENYRYRVLYTITNATNASTGVVNTGTAKRSGLKSYTGVVWHTEGEKYSAYILCETNQASMSAPSITISPQTNGDLEYRCGEDSRDTNE